MSVFIFVMFDHSLSDQSIHAVNNGGGNGEHKQEKENRLKQMTDNIKNLLSKSEISALNFHNIVQAIFGLAKKTKKSIHNITIAYEAEKETNLSSMKNLLE